MVKTYTVRPDNPWMTEEILNARRMVRRIERRRRSTGLAIDKELLATALGDLKQLISPAKVTFLNTKIAGNTGKKSKRASTGLSPLNSPVHLSLSTGAFPGETQNIDPEVLVNFRHVSYLFFCLSFDR
jgi:hypothetical protein